MNYKMSYRNGKTDREHRFIAEDMIGRKLKTNEVVHHKDGNKRNNSPENLIVVTRSEHAKIHAKDIDKSRAVIQLDKNGVHIKTWKSARAAARSLNLYPGNISKCCHGQLKTTGGFAWKFAE